MTSNQQLNFLQKKIYGIGSAIFFNLSDSDSLLKLPTSIVNTLRVDDYGYVWFIMQKPKQHLREFERDFPVRLDFFRKGTNYFLQVIGKALVVTEPEEINHLGELLMGINYTLLNEMVLVKVKIMKVDYYEKAAVPQTWWRTAIVTVSSWFGYKNTYYPAATFVN